MAFSVAEFRGLSWAPALAFVFFYIFDVKFRGLPPTFLPPRTLELFYGVGFTASPVEMQSLECIVTASLVPMTAQLSGACIDGGDSWGTRM